MPTGPSAGEVHDDAAAIQGAGLERFGRLAGFRFHRRAQNLPRQIGQIGGTRQLQYRERHRRGGEHRRQAKRHGGRMAQQPGAQPQHDQHARLASPNG
ncbi:hypothetical protein G6F57_022282 [Rhizopus arrhizus]|nr:hypothetical protein G6F57_022282 [Rhizopus arrhizus]